MTAVPSEGCSFEQWSGDIGDNQANSSTISVVMNTDRVITADFTGCPWPYNITVNASIYSSGSDMINASFGSLAWSAYRTTSGTTVNITATAAEGYRFDGWEGAINGSEKTVSFVAGSSEPITARFSKISSSSLLWAIIGIAAVLLVLLVILVYRFMSGRKKRPQVVPTDAASPPQPQPPQNM